MQLSNSLEPPYLPYSKKIFMPSFQGNGGVTPSAHIGPKLPAASNSNTLESNLSRRDPALKVNALKFGNSLLLESAPDDSVPRDQVPSNTVKQVSENEGEDSYFSNASMNNNCSRDKKQGVMFVRAGYQ